MGCNISQGRERQCKSQIGGLKNVYIFPFIPYNRSQIVLDGLTVTDFPQIDGFNIRIYRYEAISEFIEPQQDDKSYRQSLTLRFLKVQQKFNTEGIGSIEIFQRKDVRVIIEDNNGTLRLLGAYNGLFCSDVTQNTGGSKSDFVGYDVKFDGLEETPALFLDDLSLFEVEELLLLEDATELLYENNEYIALE